MSGIQFQGFVDNMLGYFGNSFGVPYAAYRLTRSSGGDFPNGWIRLSASANILRNRVTSLNIETNLQSQRTLWYELAGDLTGFLLGDVFLPTIDPPGVTIVAATAELDGFALASHRPTDVPIGARLDRRVGIYRPLLAPAAQADGSLHWRSTHDADTPLILAGGIYAWGTPGAAASLVPAGFGTNDRASRGEEFGPDKIGIVPTPRYFAYLPPLPGYIPAEGDALIAEDGSRYTVVSPYRQETGVVGSQLLIERYISQSG